MKEAYRYTTVAGNAIFTRISSRSPRKSGEKRQSRMNPTVEQVQKLNERYSVRELCMRINYHFTAGDLHAVLTFGKAPSPSEAKAYMKRFMERLRSEYRKRGIVLKWISVTEFKHKRIHHHLIISAGLTLSEIEDLWGHGGVRGRVLNRYGHYWKLGEYLVKETKSSFRDSDNPFKRRWSCSRNVVAPPTIREEVSTDMLEEPHIIKGYYLDQESVHEYECPITGKRFLEYIQLAINNPLTRYKRGRKAKDSTISGATWLAHNIDTQLYLNCDFETGEIL